MGKMMTIKEAALATGLSEYELRQGIKQQRYPYYKVGLKGGKYLMDYDLIMEVIRNRQLETMQDSNVKGEDKIDFRNGLDKIQKIM